MSAIARTVPQGFYEPDRLQVFDQIKKATELVVDVAALVTDYAIHLDLFGAAEWKRYFNQDVGEEPSLPEAFWKFWHSPDSINPAQKVWETHLPPVLRPEFVIHMDTRAREDFCLTVMGQLIKKPKEGPASKYYDAGTDALRQHGRSEAGPACWLVMRKDVFGRNQPYAQQVQSIEDLRADYEAGPSAIDVVTVVFTRFVVTGERYLGDNTGVENRCTGSRCKETVDHGEQAYPVAVGGHSLVVEDRDPGLIVAHFSDGASDDSAIAGLRKFAPKEI